jgi:hypothetical protein
MLKKESKSKFSFMRVVSQMMAIVITIATVLTVSPGVIKASAPAGQPPITSATATVSNNKQTITVAYDVYADAVNPDPSTLAGFISITRDDGDTYLLVDDNVDNTAIMSDGKLIITLATPLSGTGNQISVESGALMNRAGTHYDSLTTFHINYPSALTATGTQNENKVVTTTFNYTNIISNVENLKEAIKISSDGGNSYHNLATEDTAVISNNTLTVTFNAAVTSSSFKIKILAGGIRYGDTGVTTVTDADLVTNTMDLAPPEINSIRVSQTESGLYITFNKNTLLNNTEDINNYVFLNNKITYSKNGGAFVPLTIQNYSDWGSNTIGIYNYSIDFTSNVVIKFAADTFKSENGVVLHSEITKALNPPEYQSAALSDANTKVTLTFNENVINAKDNYTDLKDYIGYSEDGNYTLKQLGPDDTVSIVDGKLVVDFTAGLNGDSIVIYIQKGALKNSNGIILDTDTVTQTIKVVSDLAGPRLKRGLIADMNHTIVLFFDEAIINHTGTDAALKAAIHVSAVPGRINESAFPFVPSRSDVNLDNATVSIHDNLLVIHFADQQTLNNYNVTIDPNTLADTAGNISDSLTVDNIYINPLSPPEPDSDYTFIWNNNRWLNIGFDKKIFDNTLNNGVSNLHDLITISTDAGVTYHALGAEDIVAVQDSRVVVYFKQSQNNSFKVKIAGNAIKDRDGNIQTESKIMNVATNVPDLKGNFYSNTASEFLFEDNSVWRSKIQSVSIYEDTHNDYQSFRKLQLNEYTISSGKITVNPGVFKQGVGYSLNIKADGYDTQSIEGYSIAPNETFYMTAPVLTRQSGITASVNVKKMYHYSTASTIIFQLLNGTTPVSIIALDSNLADGTYTANFNVTDATNPNYTVKAFIVSKYSNDPTNVGLNLATVITQNELDQVSNNE